MSDNEESRSTTRLGGGPVNIDQELRNLQHRRSESLSLSRSNTGQERNLLDDVRAQLDAIEDKKDKEDPAQREAKQLEEKKMEIEAKQEAIRKKKHPFSREQLITVNAKFLRAQIEVETPGNMDMEELVDRMAAVLDFLSTGSDFINFIESRVWDHHESIEKQKVNVATKLKLEQIENPDFLPFFHAVHMKSHETGTDFAKPSNLDLSARALKFRDSVAHRLLNLPRDGIEPWKTKFLFLEHLIRFRSKFSENVIQAYSDLGFQICGTNNHPQIRETLIHWRLKDDQVMDDLPFLNYVDNILCFLIFEQEFPEHFESPDEPEEESEEDSVEKAFALKKPAKERNITVKEIIKDIQIPNLTFFSALGVMLTIIGVIVLIVYWYKLSTESVLASAAETCATLNTQAMATFDNYFDQSTAALTIIRYEYEKGGLNLSRNTEEFEYEIDRLLTVDTVMFSFPAIFLSTPSYFISTGTMYDKGYVTATNLTDDCLWQYERTGLVRNESTGFLVGCGFNRTARIWFPSGSFSSGWVGPYLFYDDRYGFTRVASTQNMTSGEFDGVFGIDVTISDLNSELFSKLETKYDGLTFAYISGTSNLIGYSSTAAKSMTKPVHIGNSSFATIESIASALTSSKGKLSNLTTVSAFLSGNYMICAHNYSSSGVNLEFVTAFSKISLYGKFNTTIAFSVTLAVLAVVLTFVLMFLAIRLRKLLKKEKHVHVEEAPQVVNRLTRAAMSVAGIDTRDSIEEKDGEVRKSASSRGPSPFERKDTNSRASSIDKKSESNDLSTFDFLKVASKKAFTSISGQAKLVFWGTIMVVLFIVGIWVVWTVYSRYTVQAVRLDLAVTGTQTLYNEVKNSVETIYSALHLLEERWNSRFLQIGDDSKHLPLLTSLNEFSRHNNFRS
jgi:hypothetical protein